MRSVTIFASLAILVLVTMSQAGISEREVAGAEAGAGSRSDIITAEFSSPPIIDGTVTEEDAWDKAGWDEVYLHGGTLTVKVKHDGMNLFVLVQCVDVMDPYCPTELFFEDDGVSPERELDNINEDHRYVSDGGYVDAHWDAGWAADEEGSANKDGGMVSRTVFNTETQEWWHPLNTGDMEDISVVGDEELGFAIGQDGGWPTETLDMGSPGTWGTLRFTEWPDYQPVAKIISPLEGDLVRGDLDIKVRAYDPNPSIEIQDVLVSVNESEWYQAEFNDVRWVYSFDTWPCNNTEDLNIRVKAFDGTLYSKIDEVNVKVWKNQSNLSPQLSKGVPEITFLKDEVLLDALYLDDHFWDKNEEQVLEYSVLGGSKVQTYIDENNSMDIWAEGGWTGTETLIIRASDGQTYREVDLWVNVINKNEPPLVDFDGLARQVMAVDWFEYQIEAEDPEGGRLNYMVEDGPEGVIIDQDTGELSWFPDVDQVGDHTMVVSVSDGKDNTTIAIPVEVHLNPFLSIQEVYGIDKVWACPCEFDGVVTITEDDRYFMFVFYLNEDEILTFDIDSNVPTDIYLLDRTDAIKYRYAESSDDFDRFEAGSSENAQHLDHEYTSIYTEHYVVMVDNSEIGKAPSGNLSVTYRFKCTTHTPVTNPEYPSDEVSVEEVCAILGVMLAIVVAILLFAFITVKLSGAKVIWSHPKEDVKRPSTPRSKPRPHKQRMPKGKRTSPKRRRPKTKRTFKEQRAIDEGELIDDPDMEDEDHEDRDIDDDELIV